VQCVAAVVRLWPLLFSLFKAASVKTVTYATGRVCRTT
jgi:hypothetical protein